MHQVQDWNILDQYLLNLSEVLFPLCEVRFAARQLQQLIEACVGIVGFIPNAATLQLYGESLVGGASAPVARYQRAARVHPDLFPVSGRVMLGYGDVDPSCSNRFFEGQRDLQVLVELGCMQLGIEAGSGGKACCR